MAVHRLNSGKGELGATHKVVEEVVQEKEQTQQPEEKKKPMTRVQARQADGPKT